MSQDARRTKRPRSTEYEAVGNGLARSLTRSASPAAGVLQRGAAALSPHFGFIVLVGVGLASLRLTHPLRLTLMWLVELVLVLLYAQTGKLKLFYLPPYSPQLNPDEQVWAHVKRRVSRQLVQSKDEMKRLALGALRRIQKLPELVKSFFRQPECQYAAIWQFLCKG